MRHSLAAKSGLEERHQQKDCQHGICARIEEGVVQSIAVPYPATFDRFGTLIAAALVERSA